MYKLGSFSHGRLSRVFFSLFLSIKKLITDKVGTKNIIVPPNRGLFPSVEYVIDFDSLISLSQEAKVEMYFNTQTL